MAPAARPRSRFERRPRATIAATLVALFALAEAIARVGYALDRPPNADTARLMRADGIEDPALYMRELDVVEGEHTRHSPYRWFALPPNAEGRFHRTDRFGFRNGPLHAGAARIAFFGGSTTYSVRTAEEGAVPGLINGARDRSRVEAVNYGVGGYSSTAELATFIEVTRRPDHGIKWAVFLDGVNEVGRYAEGWQDGPADAPFYDVMGYPWSNEKWGFARELGVRRRPRLAIVRWVGERVERLELSARGRALARGEDDYRRAGRTIADIYFANLADIRALARDKGIEPLFFLQPSIYDLSRPSAREQRIRARISARVIDFGRLQAAAYGAIRADARFAAFGVHDITDAFEGRAGEIFFDECHVTSAGNVLLARRIEPFLPH